jgi:alanine racemase
VNILSVHLAEITKGKLHGDPGIEVGELLFDSRQFSYNEGMAFFAITGINHDGHAFINKLFRKGIRVFVVQKLPPDIEAYNGAAFILVTNTIEALQLLAAYRRELFKGTVIAVTGSAGKTIVKEWLSDIISLTQPVIRSPKSYNSQIGVPLSIWKLDNKFKTAVIEAGISLPGEMIKLQHVIDPQIGVFTNIGDAHQENFSDFEDKIREKLLLFKNTSIIVYCSDHRKIHDAITNDKHLRSKTLIDWSFENTGSVIFAQRETASFKKTIFRIRYKGADNRFEIPFGDRASVENAMTVTAACLATGIDPALIGKGLSELTSVAMRMELKTGINNCLLIEDYYNSDPGSLGMALDYLKTQPGARSTLILSDFMQSGRNEKELYTDVAALVNKMGIDRIIGIGRALSSNYFLFSQKGRFFYTTDDFIHNYSPGDFKDEVILIKGARVFEFEKIGILLEQQKHQTVLEINLDAISHNLNEFRRQIEPGTRIMAMVKAFAYGAGPSEIAGVLEYHRVDYLGVAYADEGVVLREAGITIPVMVMNSDPAAFELMIKYRLEPELYSLTSFDEFVNTASKHGLAGYPVHLKIDTGMHRLGFIPEDIEMLAGRIKATENIKIISVFSHLAASEDAELDSFTHKQVAIFNEISDIIKSVTGYSFLKHILNSSGIVRFPEYQFDMVRPGIGIYGIGSFKGVNLKMAGTFKTRVSQVKTIQAGEPVGYNCSDVSDKERVIAILPVGYADGLNRKLGNSNGNLFIAGTCVPIIGNVCMDMCMADVSGLDVEPGSEVEIFGKNLPVTELALKCGTIPYEILTSIPQRVKRTFYRE